MPLKNIVGMEENLISPSCRPFIDVERKKAI
jgi:hypothetical protein